MKEEERKWADEDNKADDVDVTLLVSAKYQVHVFQCKKRRVHLYLVPNTKAKHPPPSQVGSESELGK